MEKKVFQRPRYLKKASTHYCPGCGHSILHRLVAEVIGELGIGERTIGVPPAGCAVLAYDYIDVDMERRLTAGARRWPRESSGSFRTGSSFPTRVTATSPPSGRPKRSMPRTGGSDHRHLRQQRVLRHDRRADGADDGHGPAFDDDPGRARSLRDGYPVDLSEMLAVAKGTVYIERTSVTSPKNILRTKRAITKAFRTQIDGLGFSLVEVLSPCPTNWKLSPVEAARWAEETMTKTYPLKVIKDLTGTPARTGTDRNLP
jgi:2-oxoglutarate ferredoxin oxidoreductase subunit beta